jgi:hypothetical protein
MGFIQIEQNLTSNLARKEIEHEIRFVHIQPVDDMRYVGGIEILKNIQEEEFRTGPDDVFDVLNELIVDLDQFPVLLGRRPCIFFFVSHLINSKFDSRVRGN